MSKKPLIAGNWKMELSHKAAIEVAGAIKKLVKTIPVSSDIVVCPSPVALSAIAEIFQKSAKVSVGAQNIAAQEKGAFTGQTSVLHIKPLAAWCIVGHSEVRAFTGESDAQIVQQTALLLRHGINPIICIGETGQERDRDQTVAKITRQIVAILEHTDRAVLTKAVIAYEPIWAIGTGITPEPDQVSEIILLIRKLVASHFDNEIADRLRILYGGSVKPDNVAQYIGGPCADGVLVGGASIHPRDFVEIIKQVQEAYS